MEHSDLLRYVAEALQRLKLPYFITGSTATIFFGEPRFTNDIDVVVDLPLNRVADFRAAFPEGEFYLSEDSIRRAIKGRSQFNILHPTSGLKVDIMIPADTPFERSRFLRAVRLKPAPDYEAMFGSVEDLILKKMEFFQMGGSEKHLRDITGVLKISGEQVDRAYIEDWAERLGLESIWRAILDRLSGQSAEGKAPQAR